MEDKVEKKSLTDQIVEKMLESASKEDQFNGEVIEKLKDIYKTGNLKKQQRIIEVIKPKSEG